MLLFLAFLVLLAHHLPPAVAFGHSKRANTSDVLDWINPLIGSQKGGNVFAGTTVQNLPLHLANSQRRDFTLWHGKR
jgi:hypothetical protein